MILSFWMECFLEAQLEVEQSDLSVEEKDQIMILYVS